ncbi:hypothetical protein [Pseudobacteroides cellulosolvens]|uniref:Uncharacterized protein n=1 Tax=Pseudobacteroides cellulosolvens ATCC 35603 = DSM 2933 TaxID=398512 RepID=A0A0L6JQI0_9FIRM|nr:hypothetical protein [Pseudobacteroides cellulosolvens]KNY27622.1 hypothetical protein Bccel_2893 [Pseudobacteroides cellulosolvens ATCC 35603 = DSM 2933]
MNDIVSWLLEGPAWVKYAIELQILNLKPDVNILLQDCSVKKVIDRIKSPEVGIPALRTMKVPYTSTGNAH